MMIREVLTQGAVKEFQRSTSFDRPPLRSDISKSSPRYGLMRNPHRTTFNWFYAFIGLLFIFFTGSLVFHSSMQSVQSIAPSRTLNADSTAIQVAYMALKLTELQEKVLQASIGVQEAAKKGFSTSLPNALTDLQHERTRNHNVLAEIANGLDGIATLLKELKESEIKENSIASTLNNPVDKVSNGERGIMSAESGRPTISVQSQGLDESNLAPSDPLYDFFEREEIRNYIKVRENLGVSKNFMGVNATYGTIGHACVTNKPLLEKYMDYEIGENCRDDWVIAQQLIIRGCEPLPRRRCRARGPKSYKKPLPANESLWAVPANENILWDHYFCKDFACLADYEHRRKFFKCSPCFDLQTLEKQRWMVPNTTDAEFLIKDVLAIKPDEIRVGLDYSMGTGTFAARMKEHDVTIVSTTLNLGAPFSETIALRGLIPLYISINQRLPFFDNTLDIVHTTMFLDAWIHHQLLDFILFDFDRVLRPGGLLWLDRFFCHKEELAGYLFYFKRLRYKAHMWITVPKTDKSRNEVYFSAVWEKPQISF